jgi:hypothetical protein
LCTMLPCQASSGLFTARRLSRRSINSTAADRRRRVPGKACAVRWEVPALQHPIFLMSRREGFLQRAARSSQGRAHFRRVHQRPLMARTTAHAGWRGKWGKGSEACSRSFVVFRTGDRHSRRDFSGGASLLGGLGFFGRKKLFWFSGRRLLYQPMLTGSCSSWASVRSRTSHSKILVTAAASFGDTHHPAGREKSA